MGGLRAGVGRGEQERQQQSRYDSRCMKAFHGVYGLAASVSLFLLIVSPAAPHQHDENGLAVLDGGVERSEDAPYVSSSFQFLPGDYLYFTFHIAGFKVQTNEKTEIKSVSLEYEVTPQDANNVPLAPPFEGKIQDDLSKEDKNWTPKRRASFLLPSYVAAGEYHVHVVAKDLVGKTEVTRDYPFQMGGVHVSPGSSVQTQDFEFLRNEDDANALELPAYAPGDTVWARFQMIDFKLDAGNKYRLSYGLKVLRPDGKAFLDEANAARIESDSFYPAQYVPGELQITTPKNAAHGSYTLTLTVRDLVANQTFELKRTFSIE